MKRTLWLIRESALGDVILCEPVLAALAARHPGAVLTLVTRAAYHPLFAHHPQLGGLLTPAQARRLPPPDLSIDLQNRIRTRLLAARAGERRHWRKRRGFDLVRTLGGRPLHRSYRGGPHQLERMAASLGLPHLRPPELPPTPEALAEAARLVPPGAAVLVPGAGQAEKRWPIEHFRALALRLAARGLPVVAVGGPGEGPLLEAVVRHTGTVVPVTMALPIIGALLAQAAVVVGNDSGLMQLAAAVGAAAVVIFGPTPPGRWGPAAGRGLVVARDLPCAPCSDHGRRACPLGTHACLQGLSVDDVFAAASGSAKIS